LSNISATMATMLNIRPILTIRHGKLDLHEKVRTQKKAWERVIELSALKAGDKQIEKMCILHVDAQSMAEQFKSEIASLMHCPHDILFVEVTLGLSVPSGAGMLGTVFVIK
jgi:fatty acid-binding protein DegV